MKETSAQDVTGFLLSCKTDSFRIYHEGGTFTDYDLAAEDIKVLITDDSAALYEGTGRQWRLDYTAKVLGNPPGDERPAVGITGFFLYNPFTHRHFFRVYGENDPKTGRKPYKDYKVCINEMEMKILAKNLSLFEDDERNCLSWSSKYLSKGHNHVPKSL